MDENNIDNEKLFAIKLADNEKKVRDKCLAKITNYIRGRSAVKDGKQIAENSFFSLPESFQFFFSLECF